MPNENDDSMLSSEASSQITVTFDEIKTLIEDFSGKEDVQVWLQKLDEIFELLNLTELKKFIIIKRLIIGTAASAVNAHPGINSYTKVKDVLLKEFRGHLFLKDILKELGREKLQPTELRLDLAYRIYTECQKYEIETKSTLEFIIEALPETPLQKQLLYTANT